MSINNLQKIKENIVSFKIEHNKKINLGIEVLRCYMSFSIVVLHFLKKEYNTKFFTKFICHCHAFYVPTFFLISFYLSFNTYRLKNITKLKERLIRILLPYCIWPSFLWIRNILINYKNIKFNYSLYKPILFQILIGCEFYRVFWFQFDLIIITIIFSILVLCFDGYTFNILKILGIFFLIINHLYENKLSIYSQIGSIKLLLKAFVFSVTGLFLSEISILKLLKKKRYIAFKLIIPLIFFISEYFRILQISKIFQVILIEIIIICSFLIFSLIPFELIKYNIVQKIIKKLTSNTGGIYYIHCGVRTVFSTYFKIFSIGDFKSCIINYIVCYCICIIGTNLFKNSKLRYLFF